MKYPPVIIGADGKRKQRAMTLIGTLPLGTPWRVEVSEYEGQASSEAKGYYWGVVIPEIADFTGDDPESVHDYMGRKFLPCVRVFRGKEYMSRESTARMGWKKFSKFMDRVIAFAASDIGVIIPPPIKDR